MSKPISRLEGGDPAAENRVGPRWMWPVILMGLVTAGSLLWWAIPAQDPMARLAAARTFFEAGDLVRSAREAELAYEWSEGDSVTRGAAAMVLARIAEAHDRLSEAATWYDRVPDLSPDAPTARLSAGMLYAEPLHRLGASIDRFTRPNRSTS